MERGRGAFGASDLPVPFIQASPDELSPRSLRSSLRSNQWLGALGSQTPPPPSSNKSAMAKQSRFIKRHKRSLSDPDLKDIKKNVDSQLSAFSTLVANLEVKKEIMERSRQKEAAANGNGATAGGFISSSGNIRTTASNGQGGGSILLKLKAIAEAFVNTPPDALHSREIVRQIQKLHLNAAKTATSLERELMIKLLFIISTCSRLEEYKVCPFPFPLFLPIIIPFFFYFFIFYILLVLPPSPFAATYLSTCIYLLTYLFLFTLYARRWAER
jgi:hypothetical protein